MTCKHACRLRTGCGAAAVFALVMSIFFFAIMPEFALAAERSSRSAAQENPRFASLLIEIWPEYDRRAALVLLKGELAADVALPAAVSIRIPASSGGPLAVAFATSGTAKLFNQAYERINTGNFITLRLRAAERFLHVEFYDEISTSTPDRRYTYVWPGDLTVDQFSVRVQEPAAASNVAVRPDLGPGFADPDGLVYRTAALGILKAGRQLPIEIRYTKADSRTSSEILKLNAPESTPPAIAGFVERIPRWLPLLVLAVVAALAAATGAALLWWRRRRKAPVLRPGDAWCPQCGGRLAAGGRFCSTCGAPVKHA